jgi:hypothetical protein
VRRGLAKGLVVGAGLGLLAVRELRRRFAVPVPQNEMVKAIDAFKRDHGSEPCSLKLVMMPSDDGEPMWGYWCQHHETGIGVRARRLGTIRLAEPGEAEAHPKEQ